MALASVPAPAEIVDLRQLRASSLKSLLQSEELAWHEKLHWDYRPSTDLLCRHIDAGTLPGFAAVVAGQVVGYCFYLQENRKGLLGDLYVLPAFEGASGPGESTIARQLLGSALDALMQIRQLLRIEVQLIHFGSGTFRDLFEQRGFDTFNRLFLYKTLQPTHARGHRHAPEDPAATWILRPWVYNFDEMAELIVDAYQGHIDCRLNDQYATLGGARKFLNNIVNFPGCGTFQSPFSFQALDRTNGELIGAILVSEVASRVAHITQICVRRGRQRGGVGRALLNVTLRRLEEAGFEGASLTVTASNAHAVRLYRTLGFRNILEFNAYAADLS